MTLQLIVVRHAIAFERDRGRWPEDALRPLTPAGKRRFRKAAQGLRSWSPRVEALVSFEPIHSGATDGGVAYAVRRLASRY